MARYTVCSLDVNDKLALLCRRWGTEEVLRRVKDWAAFMDVQIATYAPHPLDQAAHIDGSMAGVPDGRQRRERAVREASVPSAPLTDLGPADLNDGEANG